MFSTQLPSQEKASLVYKLSRLAVIKKITLSRMGPTPVSRKILQSLKQLAPSIYLNATHSSKMALY